MPHVASHAAERDSDHADTDPVQPGDSVLAPSAMPPDSSAIGAESTERVDDGGHDPPVAPRAAQPRLPTRAPRAGWSTVSADAGRAPPGERRASGASAVRGRGAAAAGAPVHAAAGGGLRSGLPSRPAARGVLARCGIEPSNVCSAGRAGSRMAMGAPRDIKNGERGGSSAESSGSSRGVGGVSA